MIEKFSDLKGNILDPTVGCGGLLAACIIAGANPRKCYGIELDEQIILLCRDRLAKLGVPRNNIKLGDALKQESYEFDEKFESKSILYLKIEYLGFLLDLLSGISSDFLHVFESYQNRFFYHTPN